MTTRDLTSYRTTSGATIDVEAFAAAGGTLQPPTSATTSRAELPAAETRGDAIHVADPVNDRDGMRAIFGGRATASGARVTPASALTVAAVYKCVNVLATDIASLPLKLYRRTPQGRELAREHPLYSLLQVRGNDVMTAMKLRELIVVYLALWGNFFAELQRDGRGRVVAVWPIHPARVGVRLVTVARRPRLKFDVYDANGSHVTLDQDDVLFIPGLGTGVVGKSPIQLHAEGLGVAIQAEKYGARFYANDARPGLVLKHPAQLSDQAYDRLRKDHEKRHQGAGNAFKVAILEEGMSAETIGLPPEDAQFLETRTYQARDVYGIYRVPPHKAGDLEHATFANIEHLQLQYVGDSLRGWMVRIEQGVQTLLDPDEARDYYAKHQVDALLRGDLKTRYEAHAVGRSWGWLSANDVREIEDLNTIENGDVYLQPLNMVPAGTDPMAAAKEDLDDEFDEARMLERRAREARALPARYDEARALESVYREALARVVAREVRETRAQADELLGGDEPDVEAFTDWLVTFSEDQAEWTQRRMLPSYQAMADAMIEAASDELGEDVTGDELDKFVRDYAAAYGRRHAGRSRGQLLEVVASAAAGEEADAVEERLAEWEEKRARTDARRERQRSSNAITQAAWAALGVATLTWRAVGKSCPICDEMDGRTTKIGRAFAKDGDTVGDLDVTGTVTHPPIHDGCDCIMMPGTSARSRPTAAELRRLHSGILGAAGLELPSRRALPAAVDRKPRTRAQRRNAWIRSEYRKRIAERYGERDVIIEELRTGTFEGEPYTIAFPTCRKACDGSA